MKISGRHALAVLFVVALLFSGAAIGQTPVLDADCTQDPGCSTLKEQAAERSRNGDLLESLRLYKLAYEVRPDPRLIFNIARLLHKQGKTVEARPYYQKFIEAPIHDEEQKQRAREYLGQIQAAPTTPVQQQSQKSPNQTTASLPSPALRINALPAGKPVYKKWWFWTAIGGGVLAITAIGLGVGLSLRQPSVPADINTYEPSF